MRLLDQIAHSAIPFIVRQNNGNQWRLTSACDFRERLCQCPVRYVLTDDLIRMCTALAFSEGDQLVDCLDLLHVPSQRLWIEWNEAPRLEELARTAPACANCSVGSMVLRRGALFESSLTGRRGVMRTFWVMRERPDDPLVASLETHFDFDDSRPIAVNLEVLFEGGSLSLLEHGERDLGKMLRCATYRFDESWCRYYQHQSLTQPQRAQIARQSLGAVAFDLPVLLGLFLLQAARCGLPERSCDIERLNAKRHRCGKQPLLEHVELAAPVFSDATGSLATVGNTYRLPARRHHVRGHLVRRHDLLCWRSPHWRGHVRLGQINSRTVSLHSGFKFNRGSATAIEADPAL
jgi:hypothetical protein